MRQGEGAVAAIGQAPTKFVLVSPTTASRCCSISRLRDAFIGLPATPAEGPGAAGRARPHRGDPAATRAGRRTGSASPRPRSTLDGRAGGRRGAGARPAEPASSAAQRARADLVAGAARRRRRGAGARPPPCSRRAERGVEPRRRVTAAYGRYIAASLADPKRAQPEPGRSGRRRRPPPWPMPSCRLPAGPRTPPRRWSRPPRSATRTTRAWRLSRRSSAFRPQPPRRHAQRRSPAPRASTRTIRTCCWPAAASRAPSTATSRARSPTSQGRRPSRRARPRSGTASASWNPSGTRPWRRRRRSARAIAEDPDDPVAYANLAIHILDQSRVAEAGALIDKALELDPAFHVGYVARGRYLLQKGEGDRRHRGDPGGLRRQPGLFARAARRQPIAYYQNGDEELAAAGPRQRRPPRSERSRRVDRPHGHRHRRGTGPTRRSSAPARRCGATGRGAAISRRSRSTARAAPILAEAYRFIGLNEWARFYGDRVFNPFDAASYFDQAASVAAPQLLAETSPSAVDAPRGADADLAAFNLDRPGPALRSAGRLRPDRPHRPPAPALPRRSRSAAGSIDRDGRIGWETDANVQGFVNNPVPTSFSLNAEPDARQRAQRSDRPGGAPTAAAVFIGIGALGRGPLPGLRHRAGAAEARPRVAASTPDRSALRGVATT